MRKSKENQSESHSSQEELLKNSIPVDTIEYLANAIDMKMGYKPGRTRRVVDLSREILKRMNKDEETISRVCRLAWVHDAGMIFVPEDVLRKTDSLTETEVDMVRQHIFIGEKMAETIEDIPNAGAIIRAHHERYDGHGFPDGLEEKEIPFEARVLAVADAYVSMTSRRPYHDVFSKGMVRGEIIANKVSWFDPVVADALIEIIDEDIDYKLREM